MRKVIFLLPILVVAVLLGAPHARADYFGYPCNYPFVGNGADVEVIAHGGGQFCDGPLEVNGTHYHCESGGGGIGGGAIGLAPIGGLTAGGFGGSGIGGHVEDCHFVCPDLFRPVPEAFPNPPAAWIKHLVVDPKYNVCLDHQTPAGPESTPTSPDAGPPEGGGKPMSPLPLPGP